METPHYIQGLLNLIVELSDKIDNLEHKLDDISTQIQNGQLVAVGTKKTALLVPDFIPEIGFQQWLQSFEIGKQDVMGLLETNILDGFKCCVIKYMENMDGKPIWSSGLGRTKQLYLYDIVDCVSNEKQWRSVTDDDICVLIEIIWRKMIEYYFIIEEEELLDATLSEQEQTLRDMNKKVLLDMKKKLTNKHIKDIYRCIVERCGTA